MCTRLCKHGFDTRKRCVALYLVKSMKYNNGHFALILQFGKNRNHYASSTSHSDYINFPIFANSLSILIGLLELCFSDVCVSLMAIAYREGLTRPPTEYLYLWLPCQQTGHLWRLRQTSTQDHFHTELQPPALHFHCTT